MPTNSTPQQHHSRKEGLVLLPAARCPLFAVLPLVWFVATPFLPDEVFGAPI
ncbi:hypothetical protein [Streptomyces inhibens]|uniref:hypothetical protein n=1 Tax=Streptomyces inhibens TaxID=2293571 RepID=UPI0015F24DF3|nr:hypothetical protein [Streptomyces inhibens]